MPCVGGVGVHGAGVGVGRRLAQRRSRTLRCRHPPARDVLPIAPRVPAPRRVAAQVKRKAKL